MPVQQSLCQIDEQVVDTNIHLCGGRKALSTDRLRICLDFARVDALYRQIRFVYGDSDDFSDMFTVSEDGDNAEKGGFWGPTDLRMHVSSQFLDPRLCAFKGRRYSDVQNNDGRVYSAVVHRRLMHFPGVPRPQRQNFSEKPYENAQIGGI